MYTQFYNLKEKPFNLTPDPKYLYLGDTHREALSLMIYVIRERKGFMVVTGEVGTGKTTLIHALLKNLDESTQTIFIFNPILDVRDFFKFVCIDLGMPVKDQTKGDCLLEIYQFLVESYKNKRNVVMLIDEAHNLNPFLLEEIRLLSNFETATDKLIQIILVGQPELSYMLNLPKCRPLKQRISLWCYLNPLTRKETSEYIRSRLHLAGMDTPCFTEKAVDEIFGFSKGIPREINILCENALTIGYGMDRRNIGESIVKEAIAELESPEARSRGAAEELESQPETSSEPPQREDQVEPSSGTEKPAESRFIGRKLKKTKGLSLISLIFWVYILVLSGVLLVSFLFSSGEREPLNPSSTVIMKKPIAAVSPITAQGLMRLPRVPPTPSD